MLNVEEAKEKLLSLVPAKTMVRCKVVDALGYVLAEDIFSPFDVPQYDQSAVDGFALCHHGNTVDDIKWTVQGEIKAGDPPIRGMKKNTAIRIYTGACVPVNADCVVMQEQSREENGHLLISEGVLLAGSNIRKKGSQIRKGTLALAKGTVINPAGVGFLCMLGLTQVKVFAKPSIGIVATGNELRKPGEKLFPGQIYETNSFALAAALSQTGFHASRVKRAADQKKAVLLALKKMLSSCDVLIVSGGISVGKYDLVKETLESLGVREIFYKVSQKPGKPMYAGRKGKRLVFALPGNPAASLVCYYEYVFAALRKMSGFENQYLEKGFLPLSSDFEARGDRSLFLKAWAGPKAVTILEGQGSDMLRSFSESNALIYIPAANRTYLKGELTEVHFLPTN